MLNGIMLLSAVILTVVLPKFSPARQKFVHEIRLLLKCPLIEFLREKLCDFTHISVHNSFQIVQNLLTMATLGDMTQIG